MRYQSIALPNQRCRVISLSTSLIRPLCVRVPVVLESPFASLRLGAILEPAVDTPVSQLLRHPLAKDHAPALDSRSLVLVLVDHGAAGVEAVL